MSIVPSQVCCHGSYTIHQSLQLKCHQQYQRHLACHWIIHPIFFCIISPHGAAPNASLMYWYPQNGHKNIVRYGDLSSSFKLWQPELAYVNMRYFTTTCLCRMSISTGLLWRDLISALLSPAGSRHSLTMPLALGTNKKLLHHSASNPGSAQSLPGTTKNLHLTPWYLCVWTLLLTHAQLFNMWLIYVFNVAEFLWHITWPLWIFETEFWIL